MIGLALAGALPGLAEETPPASDPAPDRSEIRLRIDLNQDGRISAEERRRVRRALRDARSQERRAELERSAAQEARSGQSRLQRLDRNQDGVIDPQERQAARRERVQQRRERVLARFDDDGDGLLSATEIDRMLQRRRPGSGTGAREEPGPSSPLLRAFDENRNGALDPEERSRARTELQRFDRDGDGRLAPEERRAFREKFFSAEPEPQ